MEGLRGREGSITAARSQAERGSWSGSLTKLIPKRIAQACSRLSLPMLSQPPLPVSQQTFTSITELARLAAGRPVIDIVAPTAERILKPTRERSR